MTDEGEPSKPLAMMMQTLNWAYDHATATLPGLGSAADLAARHLEKSGGSPEKAIDDLVAWQVGYAGAAGFISNVGGLITIPVAIPANFASVLMIQLRMIAAIADLRGYNVTDERVRTMAFICLTGSSAATLLQEVSVGVSTRVSARLVTQISAAALAKINGKVGFRLLAKAGGTGLVNLSKIVPLVGGVVGGAFDASVTRGIAAIARQMFEPLATTPEAPLLAAPEPALLGS